MLKGAGKAGRRRGLCVVDDHQGGKERNGIMGTGACNDRGLKIMDLGWSFWASYGDGEGGVGYGYGYGLWVSCTE